MGIYALYCLKPPSRVSCGIVVRHGLTRIPWKSRRCCLKSMRLSLDGCSVWNTRMAQLNLFLSDLSPLMQFLTEWPLLQKLSKAGTTRTKA